MSSESYTPTPTPPRPPAPLRRRSIFPGLLLLALGAFFLAGNLRPEWRLWELFSSWWPLILILWGVARLFDTLAARSSGQPAPRSMSGGEFFLLLFFIVIALSIGGAINLGHRVDISLVPWAESFEFTEEIHRGGVPAGSTVALRVRNGHISIVQGESDDLRIHVVRRVDALSEADARRRAEEELGLELVESAGTYELRSSATSPPQTRITFGVHRSSRSDLTVELPLGASLRLGPASGDLSVTGLAGALSVESHRGSVEVRDVTGDVEFENRSGDVRMENVRGAVRLTGRGGEVDVAGIAGALHIEGSFGGPVRVRNVSGSVRYTSTRTNLSVGSLAGRLELSRGRLELADAAGDLSLTARDYDMLLQNISGAIQVENRRAGNIDLRLHQAPRHGIEVRADKGHIELVLPAAAPFSVSAATRNGRILPDFAGLSPSHDDRRGQLTGEFGRGGPSIRLETNVGDVRIRPGS